MNFQLLINYFDSKEDLEKENDKLQKKIVI
jgi:hypothetical protein